MNKIPVNHPRHYSFPLRTLFADLWDWISAWTQPSISLPTAGQNLVKYSAQNGVTCLCAKRIRNVAICDSALRYLVSWNLNWEDDGASERLWKWEGWAEKHGDCQTTGSKTQWAMLTAIQMNDRNPSPKADKGEREKWSTQVVLWIPISTLWHACRYTHRIIKED